jgi:hypothetical protein
MDESSARRVILAEAIEAAGKEGSLLGATERDQVDRQARHEAAERDPQRGPVPPEEFIRLRARRVLAAAGVRHPALLALQEPGVWARWLQWLLPLAAFVTGMATDAVGNPHRVDLVSLPLLGIVAWNLAVYLAILAGALWPRRAGHRPWLVSVARWMEGTHALCAHGWRTSKRRWPCGFTHAGSSSCKACTCSAAKGCCICARPRGLQA